jgi:hypothetical protein
MFPLEPDKGYESPTMHTLDPNPILALQFHYYYIAGEGSVNTLYSSSLPALQFQWHHAN